MWTRPWAVRTWGVGWGSRLRVGWMLGVSMQTKQQAEDWHSVQQAATSRPRDKQTERQSSAPTNSPQRTDNCITPPPGFIVSPHQIQQRRLLVVVGAQAAQDAGEARVVGAGADEAEGHNGVLGDLGARECGGESVWLDGWNAG